MILTLLFAFQAHATEPEFIETPKEKFWGAQYFNQSLNTSLTIQDDNRKFEVSPEPPGFQGIGISYRGIGASYQSAETGSNSRSSASGFKWTIPWKRHFIEFYRGSYSGAQVNGEAFREDIEANAVGLHVTRALDPDFSFSSLYGLEEKVTSEEKKKTRTTFLSASLQEMRWKAESSFLTSTNGPNDTLGFHYLRRRLFTVNYGWVYIKYFPYFRFGALGSVGGFYGRRQMEYQTRSNLNQDESGLGVSLALSGASDVGFKAINRNHNLAISYGLSIIGHITDSFSTNKTGSSQTSGALYIGSLF